MLEFRHVEAAARIGMLAGERDVAAACTEALGTLGGLLRSDGALVVALDPFTGAHYPLAVLACPWETAVPMAADFVASPWYRGVVDMPLPPSISTEEGEPAYREGWFYETYVRPAGFRDAMSSALRHRGRYVGMVHLSSERAGAFDTDARRLLASLVPVLGALADTCGRAGESAGPPGQAWAALVAVEGGLVGELPGRERPPFLADDGFRGVLRAFEVSAEERLRVLWLSGGRWYRVVVERHALPGAAAPRPLLVTAHETVPRYGLTARELDVLSRVTLGWTNEAIARDLYLSPRTVHTHVDHILRKTGTASRAQVTALATREALLRPVLTRCVG